MNGRANAMGVLVALSCLAAAGCGEIENGRGPAAVTGGEPRPAAAATTPSAERPPEATSPDSSGPLAPDPAEAPGAASAASSGSQSAPSQGDAAAVAALPSATDRAAPAAARAGASSYPAGGLRAGASGVQGPAIARDPVPSAVASVPSAETLDFAALVARLRQTKAIGLLTKVAVKTQSEDLLEGFRAYHAQHGTATLAELRRSYDLLFLRLHSLLEDADPPLARDIDRSRTAIWEILADPRKFSASHLLPGA
ncbi:MAG TPA: hypothetical protein VHH11_05470 [Gammaproteobacteria bacterium]|nr:hypothetical protein [Gammaproteobacteria bacterium]